VESARKVAGRKCSIDSRDRRLGVPPQRQASAMQAQVSCGTAPLLWQACHGPIVDDLGGYEFVPTEPVRVFLLPSRLQVHEAQLWFKLGAIYHRSLFVWRRPLFLLLQLQQRQHRMPIDYTERSALARPPGADHSVHGSLRAPHDMGQRWFVRRRWSGRRVWKLRAW
jgi:hypothetical protein